MTSIAAQTKPEAPEERPPTGPARPGITSWRLAAAVAAAAVIPFLPSLGGQFVWDDAENFVKNPDFGGLSLTGFRWAWVTFRGAVYQPLGWLLLELEHSLWGMDPRGYHAVNLALHAAVAVVLFRLIVVLIERACPDEARREARALQVGAASAAALFAAHPLRVEAVAWVSCQTYLPAIVLAMLCVLAYLRAHPEGGPYRPGWALVAWGLGVAAMLFKAAVVGLPVALAILDAYPLGRLRPGRRLDRKVWAEKLAYFVPAALVMAMAVQARAANRFYAGSAQYGLAERLAVALHGASFYVAKTLWPTDLGIFYERPRPIRLLDWPFWADGLAVLAAGVALVAAWWRGWRGPLAAGAAYLALLGPHLGLVPSGDHIAADRYGYLASVPFFVLVGWFLWRAIVATRGRPPAWVLGISLGLASLSLGTLAWAQSRVWRDGVSLWTHAVAVSGGRSGGLIGNLADEMVILDRWTEAEALYRRAIAVDPGHPQVRFNLGLILQARRRDVEAEEQFAEALRGFVAGSPSRAKAHFKLGFSLGRRGQLPEAVSHLSRAAELRPDDAEMRYYLGLALFQMGRAAEAESQFLQALQLRPGYDVAARYLELVRRNKAAPPPGP